MVVCHDAQPHTEGRTCPSLPPSPNHTTHAHPLNLSLPQVGQAFFPCTFTVLENDDVDFLFGLDMLKRHQVRKRRIKHNATRLYMCVWMCPHVRVPPHYGDGSTYHPPST